MSVVRHRKRGSEFVSNYSTITYSVLKLYISWNSKMSNVIECIEHYNKIEIEIDL